MSEPMIRTRFRRGLLLLTVLSTSGCSSKQKQIEFDFPEEGRDGTQILIITDTVMDRTSAFASPLDQDSFQIPFEVSGDDPLQVQAAIYRRSLDALGIREGELLDNPDESALRLQPDAFYALDVHDGEAGAWTK